MEKLTVVICDINRSGEFKLCCDGEINNLLMYQDRAVELCKELSTLYPDNKYIPVDFFNDGFTA